MGYQTVAAQVFNERISDRAYATRVFRDHITQVQSEIPANRLLTIDLQEGWKPLCSFLGVQTPVISFPRTNSSRENGTNTDEVVILAARLLPSPPPTG
jgi:sulfotransferase family protein